MVLFSKTYWNDRAQKHGHTGHAEPFLYCFDQEARKFAISELISKLTFSCKNKALDFGCGSGDFAEVLQDFKQITGYDISEKVIDAARLRNAKKQNIFTNEIGGLQNNGPYDLILTVTVLQGMDTEELNDTLKFLASCLSESGFMICMEFFVADNKVVTGNTDRIRLSDWPEILKENQMKVVSSNSFYNPVIAPVNSWRRYNHNFFLQFLKLFKRSAAVKKYWSAKARQIIYQEKDVLHIENSTFEIYTIQKIHAR